MLLSAVRYVARRACSLPPSRLFVSEEVREALNTGRGVVALESTVITHGLPRPQNIALAKNLQKIVRSHNAVPATIALLDGKVHVGLNEQQLHRVADDFDSIKVSKRDIPYALVNNLVGGTTIAATMYLADAVGIRVFATGGLGGVHRGVNETFDISADLLELASTPVAVVCAGVKSILDIQKTLEYLETNSVSVIVYGNTINFPGFFTTETIWKAHTFTQSLKEIANIINCSRDMGLPTATIIACPIPKEHAAEGKMINEAIEAALMECKEVGVTSKNVTPFLLKRVNELTAGASLKTNIALLENNAHIAAKLANVLAEEERKLEHADEPKSTTISSTMNKSKENGKKAPSVV